ncbi:MAG: hypothetical protein AAFQ40_12765, partial [Cyanobacteria bacterium J06623_5]
MDEIYKMCFLGNNFSATDEVFFNLLEISLIKLFDTPLLRPAEQSKNLESFVLKADSYFYKIVLRSVH